MRYDPYLISDYTRVHIDGLNYSDTNQYSYSSLIQDKISKIYFGKMATSSTTVAGKIGYLHAEEQNWSPVTNPVQIPSPNGPEPPV